VTIKLEIIAWMKNANGTRNSTVEGFDDARVLVSGDRAEEVARDICIRFGSPPKEPVRLMGTGCVREDPAGHGLWLLSKHETGWSAFGYRLDGWDDLFRRFDVCIGAPKQDEHGQWWPAQPRERADEGRVSATARAPRVIT
jgi:hypothetical protein